MLNVGGAITSTNEMRSFNAAQLIVHTSVSAPNRQISFLQRKLILNAYLVLEVSAIPRHQPNEGERAEKSILQSQISKANELNSIPSNGKSRIENAFIECVIHFGVLISLLIKNKMTEPSLLDVLDQFLKELTLLKAILQYHNKRV